MAIPNSRSEFKQYCLRKLGHPVIQINVSNDQLEDRIDEALTFFWDYHMDGTKKTYFKYQLTPDDIANRCITLPDYIIGAVSLFPVGSSLSSNNLFNIRYQISLNDLYDLTSTTMVPYYLAMQHIQFLEQLLVGQQPIRYNRYDNVLHIDMDWNITTPGMYLLVECYMVMDPNLNPKVWGDRWLTKYATALIKQNWGENLSKYQDISLPGGQKFNGDKILSSATAEIEKLEREMIETWSLPVADMIG